MRIILCSSGYVHVDPRYIFLAESLSEQGHDVVFLNVFMSRSQASVREKKYQIFKKFKVVDLIFEVDEKSHKSKFHIFLSKFFKPKNKTTNFYSQLKDLKERAIPLFLKSIIKSEELEFIRDADLFYGLELFYGGFFALELADTLQKKFILDFKELYSEMETSYSDEANLYIQEIERMAIEKSLILPCVSSKIIDFYSNKYPDHASKFVLLENANNFQEFKVDFERSGSQKKIKFIISAGAFTEDRGAVKVIKIWEKLNSREAELYIRAKFLDEEFKLKLLKLLPPSLKKTVFFIPAVNEDQMVESLLDFDVGIIPYLPKESLNHMYCCPNKFGQYANAGLAILSTNTKYITEKISSHKLGCIYDPDDIDGAANVFKSLIEDRKKLSEFRRNSYNFARDVYNWKIIVKPFLKALDKSLNIALLYIDNPTCPVTVLDNLKAFTDYSNSSINLIAYNDQLQVNNLANYDCVVIHYYGQVYNRFSDHLINELKQFKGLKIVFAQDEYDLLEMNRAKYEQIGVDILYSACAINDKIREALYPSERFKDLKVINYLPGYVKDDRTKKIPIKQRSQHIFYRGNSLGFAYGRLGYEKVEIGQKMKQYVKDHNLSEDIEVDIEKQIYGDEYLIRMRSAKCTLITESGSGIIDNMFHDRPKIIEYVKNNPSVSFEDLQKLYPEFYSRDGQYVVNCIPPKAFEAMVCKTAIIAYEGEYSGILLPDVHYICLKKDWSNIEEVVNKINDDDFLQKMVDFCYADIICSGRFNYESFIESFDKTVKENLKK